MEIASELKKAYFPKGMRAAFDRYKNRLFCRTTEGSLTRSFLKLQIKDGSVICIHSMLSGLGYIVHGPSTVLKALQRAVPSATIMMPSFPFDGSALEYIKSNPVFDPQRTPSRSGLLSEVLRSTPGAIRSFHPTHPCVALGPQAAGLIAGSEASETPFGDDSTYGRFSSRDNAILLLIHTNNTSMVHRIQECVNMPNLFCGKPYFAKGYDSAGRIIEYKVKVHVPVIPLFLVMPGDSPGEREYVWFPDYALLFPHYNQARTLQNIRSEHARRMLLERHDYFVRTGVYKFVKHKRAEIAAIQVRPWLAKLCADVRESIDRYSEDYSYGKLKAAMDQGLLSK